MKIELKEFQEEAVAALLKHLRSARREARDGIQQAIVLSSPTGSGKTVIVTALLERILRGHANHEADREAVFLWLSDSPQLNMQSRDKIAGQSSLFRGYDLVTVEPTFSRERLEPGRVYFLNIQKLSKDSLLTKTGDGRQYTIWQTIENTATAAPEHLYLVIDEAHRGMDLSARQEKEAQTIVQKFIFGDPAVGLSPVRLIIGMSATPKKFEDLLQGSARTKRPVEIKPEDVRGSGLIKERIVLYCPDEEQPSDWTLLAEAAKRWRRYSSEWRKYCKEQGVSPVHPVLVVQVEDRAEDKPTRTDMVQALGILQGEMGQFGLNELAHCFEDQGPLQLAGHPVRKIEPSRIEQDSMATVVFFKTALSTGWDCPRAEVMMSFRRAKDHTSIAQLVGRMVRTPLARRIEGSDTLNSVALYLPHYDRAGLAAIVKKLSDPENAPPTEVVEGSEYVTVHQDPKHEALFAILRALPSYFVERVPKASNTKRLVKLGRFLTKHEIASGAWEQAKALAVEVLSEELDHFRNTPLFEAGFRQNQVIELHELQIDAGEWKEVGDRVLRVKATAENIEDLFDQCGRRLGEGLHQDFWQAQWKHGDPLKPKLELVALLQERRVWEHLESAAGARLAEWFEAYKDNIDALPSAQRAEYTRVKQTAKDPQVIPLLFSETIDVRGGDHVWPSHLYIREDGLFPWNANTWEAAVLKEELRTDGFVAWLRNLPRKESSLCVHYEAGGDEHPMYPDLIVFRRVAGCIRVDILDPHHLDLADAHKKARGLARYAERHGSAFGRIELIIVDSKERLRRLDVNKEHIRAEVKRVESKEGLEALFDRLG